MRTATIVPMMVLLTACATSEEGATTTSPQAMETVPHTAGIRTVMGGKLVHTHALLEGMALEDFHQIRVNAAALSELSEEASWFVYDTPAYAIYSDRFRSITKTMAEDAADGNLEAVTRGYGELTSTCIRCHSYLRSEHLTDDRPGSVSWAPTKGAGGG